jgi:hypothetical protein
MEAQGRLSRFSASRTDEPAHKEQTMTRISLIAASFLLSVSALVAPTAKALEVGEEFKLKPTSDRSQWTWACDTLEELRSENKQKCGTIPTQQNIQVAQKSGDAVCVKNPGSDKCYWAVIAPNVLALAPPAVAAKPTKPYWQGDGQKALDGISGFAVYLQVCDQWHKIKPIAADNVERMLNDLPFTMEQRRASFLKNMQMVKEIGVGKFCSEMAPNAAEILQTFEHIDWDR